MMLRSERQRAIARTDVRLARYSFGFRPIDVPFEANDVSPRTILSPSLGCGGEGETGRDAVSPASFSPFHDQPNSTGAQ